ncbi:hypothetical protein FQN57_006167 [Myotisia sp. PD_48]|nr:hypothetical protein FQN57_006167 [Myotisia sp. PD_48]
MSKRPRHIACRTCRERKIRCDGQQPCSRCAGQSQICVYSTPSNSDATASDLSQQLQMMNDRLIRAEAQLAAATQACWAVPDTTVDPLSAAGYPYQPWPTSTLPDSGASLSPSPFMALPIDMKSPQPDWAIDPLAGFTSVPQPPSDSSLSSSYSIPSSNYDDLILTPQNMQKLQESFFKSYNHIFPMIDRWRNIANPTVSPSEPWKSSIYYAICTHGALLSGNSALEEICYHRARKELELSDMGGSGSRFFRVETLQASLLIALYEFRRSYLPRAWISHARCSRLVQLLGLHRLDQGQCRDEDESELEEKRLTFWVAYTFDCLISISFGGSITITEREISTRLPTYIRPGVEMVRQQQQQQPNLTQVLQSSDMSPLSPFVLIIVLVTIWAQTLCHVRMAEIEEFNDQVTHEFWANHHVLDSTLARVEAALGDFGQFALLADPDVFFLNSLKHAAAISLSQAAATRAVKTRLPAALVEAWESKCHTSSMEILTLGGVMLESNALQHTEHFNPFFLLCLYTSCAYLARAIRTETPNSQMLDSIETTLRMFNQPNMKVANPSLDVFLPRIFGDLEDTRPFSDRRIDPSLWLLKQSE